MYIQYCTSRWKCFRAGLKIRTEDRRRRVQGIQGFRAHGHALGYRLAWNALVEQQEGIMLMHSHII